MRKIVIITGPTAVGKTEYTIKIAEKFNGEIVSCDSMQLYKYMDIGSAKPTAEERSRVKHHLVDEIDPREDFSVAEYEKRAKAAIEDIFSRGKLPVITGGTGLYVNALMYKMDFGIVRKNEDFRKLLESEAEEKGPEFIYEKLEKKDPKAAARIHPNNIKKVIRALEAAEFSDGGIGDFSNLKEKTEDYDVILIGLTRDRAELYDRINARVDKLVELGLVQEVKDLMAKGLTEDSISMKGIGYKEVISHLKGEYDLQCAVELIKQNTRHFAKRQMTWFRRYDDMKWFNLSEYESAEDALRDIEDYIWDSRKH